MSPNKIGQARAFHVITLVTASLTILIGGFMVIAWHSHSEWLWVTFPGLFQMKFNTSLAFIAGGAGMFAALRGHEDYARAAGGVLFFLGGVTLIQYIAGLNFHIDELLMKDYWHPDNPIRGRMSPSTAVSFICTGIVMILAASERSCPIPRLVTMESLSLVVLAISTAAIVGHLTSASFAYNWGSLARMSVHTAVGFAALATGMLALIWNRQNVRVARMPLWIPALLCFFVLTLDLSTPLGLAAGVGYIPIIFCSLWFTQTYMTFVFAATTTALTVLGYFASPPGSVETWIGIGNRGLTIGALWFVATLVYLRRSGDLISQKYMEDLKRSNQELDDFAYIASHDLKEPLRGLFNHASFLLEDYKDKIDEDGVRRLNRLGKLCQRMELLINDLLYFSRLGRTDLAMQETDPNAVIVEIQQMMEQVLSERNARIVVPRALPQIVCDKVRVTEVFRNLITNSVKYNDKAEPIVEVGFLESADTDVGPERNVFYVKDNGVGIEAQFHQEIFRIFKRLQNLSGAQETGTGVGLTFVKKIVERHDGRIWLESRPGQGTVFYFNLNCERKKPARSVHEQDIIPIPIHSFGRG